MNGFLGQLAALRAEIERMQAERQASTGLSGILIFAMNYGPPLLLWAVILFLPALPLAPLTVALCSRELMEWRVLALDCSHSRRNNVMVARAATWVTALIDGCGFLKTVGVFTESVRFCRFISVEEVRFRPVCA